MRPTTEAELAEAIRAATGPLAIRGGGTRQIGHPVMGEVLETGGLSGITLYEPGALTLVVQSGTPLADIEAMLDAEGQMLSFEPLDMSGVFGVPSNSTIGGVVATNASGPRRIQAGACRDLMLGVRFVDGTGEILKNGGRVMKNVTGYDLVKLMAGSYGTLGVISEVGFKVLPRPETTATVVVHDLALADAVRAMAAAFGAPFDVTGAMHVPETGETLIRIEGFADSVAYRADQLTNRLAVFGEVTRAEGRAPWDAAQRMDGFVASDANLWRVSVKPSDAPAFIEALGADTQFSYRLDWGGGLIWVASASAPETLHGRLQATATNLGGHATLIKGSDALKAKVPVFQPEAEPLQRIAEGLRRKFDPRGLLNPGRMG